MNQFESMRKELEEFDIQREELILSSRKLLAQAKQAMYHVHRDELEKAKTVLDTTQTIVDKLKEKVADTAHGKVGAVTAALQEWAESFSYYIYATEKRLATKEELGLGTEDYLLALSDLTGELTRRAVLSSINKDVETVKEIRIFVDELFGEFLQFNFRNGELRKKTDQIRWNLQKIEELLVKIS